MQPTPLFDELHVISDLHLGGSDGRQIFNQGPTLAALIRELAAKPKKRRLGLVINGDLVDFLAEPAATWFDPEGAVSRLDRIMADAAFAPVFDALQEFSHTPGRKLIVTLGNHDLELALPWVRERLVDLFSDSNEAARSRVLLAFDGSGFRCQVGASSVLCVHGNEVDEWNVTDHEQIRRIGRDLNQSRGIEAWKPNAGTRMVIEVMNEIKREHPFVDLLKPEFGAAVPALLILKPALAGKIADIGKLVVRMKWDGLKMRFGFLSAEDAEDTERPGGLSVRASTAAHGRVLSDAEVLRQLLGDAAGPPARAGQTQSAAELLARVEQHMEKNHAPLDLIGTTEAAARLGWGDAAWKRLMGRDDAEVLRAALESVQNDRSFALDDSDETFQRLDELVGPGIDFVISGHTHLRRALRRTKGGGFYYNTGTWARLMKLTPEQLQDEKAFADVFKALKAPTLAELDRTPFVVQQPTAACIEVVGGTTRGSLREYSLMPAGKLKSGTLAGSTFPQS